MERPRRTALGTLHHLPAPRPGRTPRHDAEGLNSALRVSFAKVAEYQKRGLVHFHAVIRFDGPDGHTSRPRPGPPSTP
uniref:replication initiator n=1 Tax=Streptomyces sp. AC1-42W TaxID=2218666 RepID=UPI00313E8928